MALHMVDSASEDFFLVKVTDEDGGLRYHGVGTLSEIVDRIGDSAYDAHDHGGLRDHYTVYALANGMMPFMVDIECVIHAPIGFTEVKFRWDVGSPTSKQIITRRESGYYRTPGA